MAQIHKTGLVVFNNGAFGGAAKRFTNLFIYLNKLYRDNFFYFVNSHLYGQIIEIYPDIDISNIRVIDDYTKNFTKRTGAADVPRYYKDTIPDPLIVDSQYSLPRKIYWFYKNKHRQKSLFRKIDAYREELGIKVFLGVSSGILPLVFYTDAKPQKAAVIFSDVDSWFTDIHRDMKKLWYRKYYSYNNALECSNCVDFLSPYILDGVKKLGVNVKEKNISVSPCSFADYSSCSAAEKSAKEIAFCSRLEPDKNPMLYLEAAKEVLKTHPDAKFHILGEGSLVNEVKEFISSNGLQENINFRFHKNPPEIFGRTAVFVSLQKNTNYPSQSMLEAMACSNAVVASNTGDTGLLVNENNGILVNNNAAEIVNAVNLLLSSKNKARELGINARKFVLENHTIEKYSDYFLNLTDRCITGFI